MRTQASYIDIFAVYLNTINIYLWNLLKHVQNTYKDCLPKPKKTPAKHNKNSEAIKLQNNKLFQGNCKKQK